MKLSLIAVPDLLRRQSSPNDTVDQVLPPLQPINRPCLLRKLIKWATCRPTTSLTPDTQRTHSHLSSADLWPKLNALTLSGPVLTRTATHTPHFYYSIHSGFTAYTRIQQWHMMKFKKIKSDREGGRGDVRDGQVIWHLVECIYLYKALRLLAEKDRGCVSSAEVMLCKAVLSCALFLTALEPLLGHPLTHLAGMSYTGPGESNTHTLNWYTDGVALYLINWMVVSGSEEEQAVNPDEMSFSEQAFLSRGSAGIGFPSFLTGDNNREGELLLPVL